MNDQAGLLGFDDALEDLGDRERLDLAVGLHQDAAVGAHGERGADGLGGLRRADRHRDDFGRLAGFLQADRLFDGDLVERIHRHLDVGEFDAGAVGLDPDFDVVIDNPFDGHREFSCFNPSQMRNRRLTKRRDWRGVNGMFDRPALATSAPRRNGRHHRCQSPAEFG